jgi:hypothetical protein
VGKDVRDFMCQSVIYGDARNGLLAHSNCVDRERRTSCRLSLLHEILPAGPYVSTDIFGGQRRINERYRVD